MWNTQHDMTDTKPLSLARESYALLIICSLDLVFTVWLLMTQRATEGNPLMAYYLSVGLGVMIGVKLVLMAMPIFIAEWARRYRPQFVHRALRFAIAAYLLLYIVAFINAGIPAGEAVSCDDQTHVCERLK